MTKKEKYNLEKTNSKSTTRIIFENFVIAYIIGFSIYSYITIQNETLSPWIFFVAQVFVSISLCLLTYNQLDNIFPPILFRDTNYKKLKTTFGEKFFYYLTTVIFVILVLFLLFLSVLYVINFSYSTGTFYLQIIQAVMYFCVIFYFLRDALSDFSGHAYCDYYKSNNFQFSEDKIKYHLLPRTLTSEMMENYLNEPFSG